jgi:hydroxymethylglutaryl-CoA reductase (NADPH)
MQMFYLVLIYYFYLVQIIVMVDFHLPQISSSTGTTHAHDKLTDQLAPRFDRPNLRLTPSPALTEQQVMKRWQKLRAPEAQALLLDEQTKLTMQSYQKNIEYFIGTVKLPVGIAGPLRVNGSHAQGDYLVPLATTEAALVASYHRGSQLITAAGGASALLLNEGVTRTPVFSFLSLAQAGNFVGWVTSQFEQMKEIAQSTTAHGRLKDIRVNTEGNHVYLVFEYTTGDASGQNMVTIATDAVFEFIISRSPVTPTQAFLDGNLSGDKKANSYTLRSVRGKKVSAEVHVSSELVKKYLHTTPEKMVHFCQMATHGGALSGAIGVNAHYANALAALYISCGQDAACVAESAIGMTRLEVHPHGGLHASVTLPNLMVGTVGGGTGLPSQQACLSLMGLDGQGHARALAEVAAALCLAGELSIAGAFCAGHFSRAHHKLAR